LERLKELFKSPLTAINKAKREKNTNKTLLILILTWILFGLSFFIIVIKTSTIILISVGTAMSVFLLGFLASIFCAYLIETIMNILGGRGKYYEGLTSLTYAAFPISLGFLITALLSLIHPLLGIIGFIVVAITVALGLSIYFKSIKELFGTDMITTLIGFLIIVYVFAISVYAIVILSASQFLPIFKELTVASTV